MAADFESSSQNDPVEELRPDIAASVDALQTKIDELKSRSDSIDAENAKREQIEKVRGPVNSTLSAIGLDESEIRHAIKALGGLKTFVIDPANDDVCILHDGAYAPIRDILPEHPVIRALTQQSTFSGSSPEAARRRKIAELETKKAQIMALPRAGQSNGRVIEVGQINRQLAELHAAAPIEDKKPARLADANLVIRRRQLVTRRDAVNAEFRKSGGRRDDLLIEASKLSREINSLSAEIQKQQAG